MSNETRHLTEAGAKLVKHFESCKEKKGDVYHPYKCPAGVLTIGWGHTNHHGRKFDAHSRWSLADCDQAFMEDMGGFEQAVRKHVTVPLAPYQFDALVSFTYNCGEGALKSSTLLKKVNKIDWDGAALEFHKWNKANGKKLNGLVRRRASESLMFQNIPDLDYDGKPDPMPQEVDNPDDA
jgi:lysozyme